MAKPETKTKKPRPSWHIDMKWIVALICLPVLAMTLIVANFYIATKRENAIQVSGTILKAMFLPQAQTGEKELAAVREAIARSPNKTLRPFPGTDIKITQAELDKYPLDELKNNLYNKLAETIYDGNSKINQTKTLKDSLSKLGLMAIFTRAGHEQVGSILIYPVLASLLLLLLLIYFSAGFGRLISPGLIFLFVGIPAVLLLTVFKNQPAPAATGEMSLQQGIARFSSTIGPAVATIFSKIYLIVVILGLVLVLAGIIGHISRKIKTRKQFNLLPVN